MEQWIAWFYEVLNAALQLYFRQECAVSSVYEIAVPEGNGLEEVCGRGLTFDEQAVVMLALMPHLCPQALDIFFVNNKNFDRPYTEFGGWKGMSHGGFLPTGETAAFILGGEDTGKRLEVMRMFGKEHWFWRENVLRLEGQGRGEPFLSGQLRVSEEVLSRILYRKEYKPDCTMEFPAKRVTTVLEWGDMVVDYRVALALEEINTWITGQRTIMQEWGLERFLKAGYRALFYGPPGTGKTLAATLLGKRNDMDVYRVDLSMIVSKYIGETEKNLAQVFDMAENRRWILFFDEADALFGKRTSTTTSNDRHANQEVAFLLQRIEDFPGTVILATNLKSNLDEAFLRRFQAMVYFPMPDEESRKLLWQKMLPATWLQEDRDTLLECAVKAELSGGSIANVIRSCALQLLATHTDKLSKEMLDYALKKELAKEGNIG